MAFVKLQFRPGVNRDSTDYANEGGWWACDHIRFRSGQPEKIGGWMKVTPQSFIGFCRQMWNWITTYNDNLLALGTNVKVYIEVGGNFYDITPLRTNTPTLGPTTTNNSVGTTNGSKTVTFGFGATPHVATTGDYVQISGVAGAGGLIGGIPVGEINGNHKITTINNFGFSIQSVTTATATTVAQGGTAIVIGFEIPPGYAVSTAGYGWGTGVWGGYTPPLPAPPIPPDFGRGWGTGSLVPVYQPLRDWWFDNFDNDLVMNIRNGEGYWWERGAISNPGVALDTKAIRLVDYAVKFGGDPNAVPIKIMQLMVSQQDKHLIAFGATPWSIVPPLAADFDPMLIRWTDQDHPEEWTPDALNTAGDIRLSRGSRIVRALPTRQEILVWTDTTLYTLQFLGTTDVYGLQEYADNVSIISPRAVISASNVTYWMGKDQFYAYTGRVETLPCTLRHHVFQNINPQQRDQIICGTNEEWHEVWWFYPSYNSDYNDSYVVYNHLEQLWFYGLMPRTAWLDTPMHDWPMACNTVGPEYPGVPSDETGYLYHHELGVDADGMPLTSYIQSSDFDLDDGEKFMLLKRLIPDISFEHSPIGISAMGPSPHTHGTPEVIFQMRPRNFPGAPTHIDPADSQPVIQTVVGQYTEQVFIRARARQMAIKIMSEDIGVQWSLGAPRIDARPDGMR